MESLIENNEFEKMNEITQKRNLIKGLKGVDFARVNLGNFLTRIY